MPSQLNHCTLMCSDVDTQSLHDVVNGPDSHLLITNKQIVSKYNVSSRRHIQSWTSTCWEPYTCGSIYSASSNSIISVTASHIVSVFCLDQEVSSNYKFSSEIFKLLSIEGGVYIVFCSGAVERLDDKAFERRKSPSQQVIDPEDTIIDVKITTHTDKILYILSKTNTLLVKLYIIQLKDDSKYSVKYTTFIEKEGTTLNTACITEDNTLMTLWSSGEFCLAPLSLNTPPSVPGKVILTIQHIKASKPAKIVQLSPTHAAVVGLDKANEGSCMLLLDTKFGVINSTKKLKMYREPPLAWVVASGIIVVEAGCLTLVPYSLDQSNISTMFSSKLVSSIPLNRREEMLASEQCCSWPMDVEYNKKMPIPAQAMQTIYTNTSSSLAEVIASLTLGSLSQSLSSTEVINYLIAEKNLELLNESFRVFNNIPENTLITALKLLLQVDAPIVQTNQNEVSSPFSDKIAKHINLLLSKPFTSVELLKSLRSMNFDNSLMLLRHIHYLIESQTSLIREDIDIPTLEQSCTWFNLILDANYTQLIISSEDEVHANLKQAYSAISFMEKFMEEIIEMQPMISKILIGKTVQLSQATAPYSLERLIID